MTMFCQNPFTIGVNSLSHQPFTTHKMQESNISRSSLQLAHRQSLVPKQKKPKSNYRIIYITLNLLRQASQIPRQVTAMPSLDGSLSSSQISRYHEDGYLTISSLFSTSQVLQLKTWAQEIHDLPRTQDCSYIPYDEINATGKQVLCRTENFCSSHPEFNSLLRGKMFLDILRQLVGRDMLLFKEKSKLFYRASYTLLIRASKL